MTLEYKITNIRTNRRKPGFVYATIVDKDGTLVVNATLDYCVQWLKDALDRAEKLGLPSAMPNFPPLNEADETIHTRAHRDGRG